MSREVIDISDTTEVIDFTQTELMELYKEVKIDETIPLKDKLLVLRQLSNTALTIKKIKVEDAAIQGDKDLAAALHRSLRELAGNPFYNPSDVGREYVPPVLPEISLNPDEDLIGLSNLDMDSLN
jgi:hypothetical protein